MEVLEKIRLHPFYLKNYEELEEAENNRKFCRHQMPHLLDVARIAYIRNLEEKLELKKEVIYAAALLHDIGKARQYKEGVSHEEAGREIADIILRDIAVFSAEETEVILKAISEHRRVVPDMSRLGRLLYESDKLSRACYLCPAEKECNWDRAIKNTRIKW